MKTINGNIPAEALKNNQKAQNIARKATEELKSFIKAGVNELEIVAEAERIMRSLGAEDSWYHNLMAFVFSGDRTDVSITGRGYGHVDYVIKDEDIVSADLSPTVNGCWGDFARTFIVSGGKVVATKSSELPKDSVHFKGLSAEETLHDEFLSSVTVDMTFEEVFNHFNNRIKELGCKNLDFHQNLGHTIETFEGDRICFEAGSTEKVGDHPMFTFEPHISTFGDFGYKRENIYYFQDGILKLL